MLVVCDISDEVLLPCVATIGFFDGVHRGHRYLIGQVKEEAEARQLRSALITFAAHPREIINTEYKPELLTTYEEKIELLESTGVDYCIVLDFTPAISHLTAENFMRDILKERYNVRDLVIGHDHRFGHNRSEGFEEYSRYGDKLGITIVRARAHAVGDEAISSSAIRRLLYAGDVTAAAVYLGYEYFLNGSVVGGYKVGRTIGFPTANLRVNDSHKLIPADGVYAVRVTIRGAGYAGMLNIGRRPTINNGRDRSIEVHILRFQADIYDCPIKISFVRRIRPEMKFAGKEQLIEQLAKDARAVESLLL